MPTIPPVVKYDDQICPVSIFLRTKLKSEQEYLDAVMLVGGSIMAAETASFRNGGVV